MKIVILEIQKITDRKQFWIIFFMLVSAVFLDFVIKCQFYYGKPLSGIPSAYVETILNDYTMSSPMGILYNSFIFFLFATIIASDCLYDEKELGVHNFIFSRVGKVRYVISKGIAIAVVVFFTILIPLLTSQLLALFAFPVQGGLVHQIAYNKLMPPDPERVLNYLESYYPYLNIMAFILIRALIGAAIAFLSYAMTFLSQPKKYTILLLPMVCFLLYTIIGRLAGQQITDVRASEIMATYILAVNPYGSVWVILGAILLPVLVGITLIKRGLNRDENFL
jgi:hypothetical protein